MKTEYAKWLNTMHNNSLQMKRIAVILKLTSRAQTGPANIQEWRDLYCCTDDTHIHLLCSLCTTAAQGKVLVITSIDCFELALHSDMVGYSMNLLRFHNTHKELGRCSVSQHLAAN